jgi:WS/DGAT C-terminal domain
MKSSEPYSLAFSNVPGLLKPIEVQGKKSRKLQLYFIPAGYTGVALSCISYVDYFKITLTVDDSIMKDPQVLLDLIESSIRECYVTDETLISQSSPEILKE